MNDSKKINENVEYYVMRTKYPRHVVTLGLHDTVEEIASQISKPIVIFPIVPNELEEADLVEYFDQFPVVSNRFYEALILAGVNNIEAFEAEIMSKSDIIRSSDSSIKFLGYRVLKITGLVSIVEVDQNKVIFSGEYLNFDPTTMGLKFDSERTRGFLMFRPVEDSTAIIVHKKLKEIIESHGFQYIEFINPHEYFVETGIHRMPYLKYLNQDPYGLELSKQVAQKLKYPSPEISNKYKIRGKSFGMLSSPPRECEGHDLLFQNGLFELQKVGNNRERIKVWDNEDNFIKFLSQQSDCSWNEVDPEAKKAAEKGYYFGRITRVRLENFVNRY